MEIRKFFSNLRSGNIQFQFALMVVRVIVEVVRSVFHILDRVVRTEVVCFCG